MSHAIENVLLFPGQGAHRDDELPALARRHRQVREVFDEIDAVAADLGAQPPGPQLLRADPPSVEALVATAPDVLQLAVYGTTLALSRILEDSGQRTFAVAGHSSGEIAALVAGGAYTLAQGAEIVIRRSALLQRLDGAGAMVALGCDAERARRVLDAVADPWTVTAVENGATQTLVSGRHDALATVTAVARALRISVVELKAAYPFHGPLLAPLVAEFAAEIRHLRSRPLTALVHSPILGRFHRQDDALGEHIAASLVAPVRFGSALRQLHDAGARSFVDCSLAGGLARLTRRCLPDVTAVPALEAMGTASAAPSALPAPVAVAAAPAPSVVPVAVAVVSSGGPVSRDELFEELAAMYAGALEYPAEVFTEGVALEADLGIDSVKQSELLARAADHYGVPERPEDFRLGDHDTMGKLVDYLWSTRSADVASVVPVAVAVVSSGGPVSRDELFEELAAMYAGALEYPAEVFTEGVALEADLGIDSVKQSELLARAADHYGVPERPEDFRLGDHDTMGKLVDYLWSTRSADVAAAYDDAKVAA